MCFSIRSIPAIAFPFIIAAATSVSAFGQSELRTWHSAVGSFSVQAELKDVRDNKVQLEKSDGTQIWVDIKNLSLSDVRYVESVMRQAREGLSTNETESNMPVAGDAVTSESGSDSNAGTDVGTGRTTAGLSKNTEVNNPFAGMRNVDLVLGQATEYDLVFPKTPSIWFAKHSNSAGGSHYQAINIRTGQSLQPIKIEGVASQKAISPDGTAFVAAGSFPPRITAYATASGRKVKDIQLDSNTHIGEMFIVPPLQLCVITRGTKNSVQVYEIRTGRKLREIILEGPTYTTCAVSPDGKQLAVNNVRGSISIYDLRSGKKTATLPTESAAGNMISVSALEFTQGGEELVALCSGSASELHAFSLKSGKLTAKHVLTQNITEMSRGQYLGRAVESLSNGRRWLLYGVALVDREIGGPIWAEQLNIGDRNPFRAMIDDQRQLVLTGGFGSARFEIRDLPIAEIEASKAIVESGGTYEDSGRPAVKQVSSATAVPLSPSVSAPLFSTMPSPVPVAPEPGSTALSRGVGAIGRGFFASPNVGKVAVAPENYAVKTKSAAIIDISHGGKVEKVFSIDPTASAHDFSPDARWLVTVSGKNQDRVDVYDVEAGKHALAFRPFDGSSPMQRVLRAKFLGGQQLLTSKLGGESIVWQLPDLRAVYSFECNGPCERFPTSGRFLHRGDDLWCIRNAADGNLEGVLEASESDTYAYVKAVSIRSDESQCAAIISLQNEDRLVVWDLATGQRKHDIGLAATLANLDFKLNASYKARIEDMLSQNGPNAEMFRNANSLQWCDSGRVIIGWQRNDQSRFVSPNTVSTQVCSLFDIQEKRFLWDYRLPIGSLFSGGPEGQLWFSESSAKGAMLVHVNIPTGLAEKELSKAPQPKLLVPEGSELSVQTEVHISGDSLADGLLASQLSEIVEQNLTARRVESSDRGGLKLLVRAEQVEIVAQNTGKRQPMLLMTCRLTDISNHILWSRQKLVGVSTTNDPVAVLKEKERIKTWNNAMNWVAEIFDPAQIYEDWYHRGLGESLVSESGEKMIELRIR